MTTLDPISPGKPGWKKRRAQIAVLEIMQRATEPHCCYRMRQKFDRGRHKPDQQWMGGVTAGQLMDWMAELCDGGHLIRSGSDPDTGWLYSLMSDERGYASYVPGENPERDEMLRQKMRALSPEELAERDRRMAPGMQNAYKPNAGVQQRCREGVITND